MKIQVNSDSTIAVNEKLTKFVEGEVSRILGRFAIRLTRVEVHLTDVDNIKNGQVDKRCMIEVRPAGAPPRTASAKAAKISSAIDEALGKMQRSLTTFFGRKGRTAPQTSASPAAAKKSVPRKTMAKKVLVKKTVVVAKKSTEVKKAEVEKPEKRRKRGPKKKRIYQARRKPWPAR